MILVDSSVWIDILGRSPRYSVVPETIPRLATCPPIIQEVLQGVSGDAAFRLAKDGFLSLPCYGDLGSKDLWIQAADLYRLGRKRGLTIRSSTDCLIAAIAIECSLTVWHADRDFDQIARFANLEMRRDRRI